MSRPRDHGIRIGPLAPGPHNAVTDVAGVRVGVDGVVIPIVGECDDSWLNDARTAQVEPADAGRALRLQPEARSRKGAWAPEPA